MIIVILDHTLGTGQSGRVKAMSNRGSNARQGSDGMAQQWPFQNKWLLLYMHGYACQKSSLSAKRTRNRQDLIIFMYLYTARPSLSGLVGWYICHFISLIVVKRFSEPGTYKRQQWHAAIVSEE